ncbi:Hint domain-containing protein [Celeribacter sp. PS-C1]|uniref:Hint domain-containing protein n=1 Tax=Celeribacter sp. PS-C1 TaxID=2820813 RepID=UPI001C679303|nr:Hint domain-containing protein [Celeribacter sp. PS-C1]MBW6418432.1 Hint domain-containing protein [Celeribacter sp. PS-C1]
MSQPLSGLQALHRSTDSLRKNDSAHGYAQSGLQVKTAWTVRRARPIDRLADRPNYALRRYEILWRGPNGDICDTTLSAPALPLFESAFNAFARGALIPTPLGPIAIEDLLPGDMIETVDNGLQRVEWIGAMMMDPKGTRSPEAKPERLYRVMADAFGLGRPAPDLVLGAGARSLLRSDTLKATYGTSQAMAPVPSLADGMSVIEVTPISSVRSYHIGLARHSLVRVNGVELESYHPGPAVAGELQGALRARFMALFPHLDDLGDFGAMTQLRLTPTDMLELALS